MHIAIMMHKGKYVYISLKVVILKGSLYTKSLRVRVIYCFAFTWIS